jgi:hypothetical protein
MEVKMAIKNVKPKWTANQVKEHIKTIQKVVELQKTEFKSEHFTAVTPEEVAAKLKRVNSPMIVSQGWSDTVAGGTFNYNIGLYNPDPNTVIWLFVHVWVGAGNADPVTGTFLNNIDTRFPNLTLPKFAGLNMAAGASASLNFSIKVPAVADKTNYIGNSCLMRFVWHDTGTYLDRGVFVFGVS